jgi:hypothetical protein
VRRLALAVVLASLIPTPAAAQDSPIAARDEVVAGRDLVGWQVAWNQWRLALPAKVPDIGDGCIGSGQPAGVFFLSGNGRSSDEHVMTFDCTIPAGAYLLTGVPESLCSDVLPNAKPLNTARKITRCARQSWRQISSVEPRLVLDGNPIPNGFEIHTPVFRFTMPGRGNVFDRPGIRRGRAAAWAHVALIRPLAPGRHTLIEGVSYRHFHNQVLIFNLTVA